MDYWSILGIEPTKDARTIKKQYAGRLKTCHPEDHPDEFIELEKAYHAAIEYTKISYVYDGDNQNETDDEHYSSDINYSNNIENPPKNNTNDIHQQKQFDDLFEGYVLLDGMQYERQFQSEDIEIFMHKLNEQCYRYTHCSMHADFDTKNFWFDLLNSPQCQELKENPIFLEQLIDFFNTNSHFYTSKLIKNEIRPFFKSLTKYDYGGRKNMLLGFIHKLKEIEKNLKISEKEDAYELNYRYIVIIILVILRILSWFLLE